MPLVKHNKTDTFEFRVWTAMRKRCLYEKHPRYHLYGGRGIEICERWGEFVNFLADMGECPFDGGSIERVDSNGNYEPANCKWVLKTEQSRNRSNVRLIDGKTIPEIAKELGVHENTIRYRIKTGAFFNNHRT